MSQPRFKGLFHGNYTIESVAECENNVMAHPAPELWCSCGFYGVKSWKDLDYQHKSSYYMEVEFYGKVIVCERGYRAAKQRILAVYATPDGMEQAIILDPKGIMTDEVLLSEMSNKLGVEVRKERDLPGYNT